MLLITACTQRPQLHHHTLFAFGTLIEISIAGTDAEQANQAFHELESDFHNWHSQWTPWQDDSDLSRTNTALQRNDAFELPASIEPLIRQSQIHYIKSDGLFNPAIGKLIRLWRFHEFDQPDIRPPSEKAIRQLLAQNPKITDIRLNGHVATNTNPDVELNFGAFAKGYAIGLAMQSLRQMGIHNAAINAGGDLSVSGQVQTRSGKREWRIGIRHPRGDGIIASLHARSGDSIFTSGDYERFYIHAGKRYHHILDPRSGYPAEGMASVTVIHPDPGTADAAATALLVAGNDWPRIARQMGIDHVMAITREGTVQITPAMADRVRFEITPPPRIMTVRHL